MGVRRYTDRLKSIDSYLTSNAEALSLVEKELYDATDVDYIDMMSEIAQTGYDRVMSYIEDEIELQKLIDRPESKYVIAYLEVRRAYYREKYARWYHELI